MAWAPDYCTTAELKSYVGISDTDDDAELSLAITAASRAIDTYCSGSVERQFGTIDAPEEWTYTSYYYDPCRLSYVYEIDDLTDVTTPVVTVDGTVTTDYTLEPVNAAKKHRPYTRIVVLSNESLAVSGTWGWTSVPTTVKQAALLQASRIFKRKDAPFGVAGSPELGSEMRLLARVDPDVAVILTGYRRTGGVG